MVGIVVVTRGALLIARPASTWTFAEHLNGRAPVCVAVDTRNPTRVYCGTAGGRAGPECSRGACLARRPQRLVALFVTAVERVGEEPQQRPRLCLYTGV